MITESVAIVLYLADTFPAAGLAPAPGYPRRGAYLTWVAWYASCMEPAMFASMSGELAGSTNKQRDYDATLVRLRNALTRGPYAMGDEFTGADILIGSALGFGRRAFPADDLLDAYLERCRARPAALRGLGLDDHAGVQAAA